MMGVCPSCRFDNAVETYFCGRCQLYLRPIGAYRLTHSVGKGGFASVYHASHQETGADAAVKILHREFLDREDIQQRFLREAQVMVELHHPHIVKLYDYGDLAEASLGVYLVMEWCEGETLYQALSSQPHGRFSSVSTKRYIQQLLHGLKHIHAKGVVHRDLKPNNLMLVEGTAQKELKILDFGLAWIDGKALTRSDLVIGSLMFMAPEQIRGRKDQYGPATDIYAVGLLLAWMLTGTHVFGDVSREQVMAHHVLETPPPLGQLCPEIRWSASLEALVAKALHKDPAQRYASAEALLQALEQADWPDFGTAMTLPTIAISGERAAHAATIPSLSGFDDTGALEPFHGTAHGVSTPGVGGTDTAMTARDPGDLRDTMPPHDSSAEWDSLAELEGSARTLRSPRQRKPLLLWLVLMALAALIGWWGLQPRGPGSSGVASVRRVSAVRTVEPGKPSLPTLKLRVLEAGKKLPLAVATLLEGWRDVWQSTADKPYQPAYRQKLVDLYHPQFRDVATRRQRDDVVDEMIQKAQNSSWMRIHLSDVYIHSKSATRLVVQFRLKCYGSTLRANAVADANADAVGVLGSTYTNESLVMLEWEKHGQVWQIVRTIEHSLSSPTDTPSPTRKVAP